MEYPFKDLQPLDEATERAGYYKDWTHIDADTFHQISELVKFIREKGYGADTREAIAQALERVYHDAMMSGNANMEVSMARKHFKDLASRLDASDNDMRNISVDWINKNLGKLDQSFMSEEFLQQMAGNTPINAVPADGSLTTKKFADKSITTRKIGDGEVKPKNTNFVKTGNNLANFIESGVILSSSAPDRRTPYEGGWVSDLISVKTGDELTLKYINRYMLYSESFGIYDNKLINGAETTITIPSNVAYIIVDTFGGFTPLAMVNFGTDALPYEPYSITIDNLVLPDGEFKQSWEEKRVDWIGDSLLEKNTTATKNTYDYVTEYLQLDSNNLGVSGTGYANKAGTKTTFYERVSQVRTNTDLVVFCGSGNDISSALPLGESSDSDTTTVAGCINTAIDNAIGRVPMAKIAIITSPPWQSSQLNNDDTLFGKYILMLKKIAYERGIPFLDLYHESGMRPWEQTFRDNFYKRDNGGGTHPDEDGHYKFMFPPTREFIKTLI